MARFRATIEGQGNGQASRLGTETSGIRARVNGWLVGVDVEAHADGHADVFTIYATHGSSPGGARAREIGRVRLVGPDNVPTFIPTKPEPSRPSLTHAIGQSATELLCRPGRRALASATSRADDVTCPKCKRLSEVRAIADALRRAAPGSIVGGEGWRNA